MNVFQYIGLFASFFGLATQMPQIYKIIKTKSAGDLSYGTLFIALINQVCWLIYAVYLQNFVYIINAVGHFLQRFFTILLKAHYDQFNDPDT
jgi:uncharacterized protein with PQ loop repeat